MPGVHVTVPAGATGLDIVVRAKSTPVRMRHPGYIHGMTAGSCNGELVLVAVSGCLTVSVSTCGDLTRG